MSKVESIEKRIEGLEELLTLSIRVGEFHISRMIRENIEGAERELKIERIRNQKKGNESNNTSH
jgi:hypothetical protein